MTMPEMAVWDSETPDWVKEPSREAVRDIDVEDGDRRFRLHVRGRELLEMTELVHGREVLVSRDSAAWSFWMCEVAVGAIEGEVP